MLMNNKKDESVITKEEKVQAVKAIGDAIGMEVDDTLAEDTVNSMTEQDIDSVCNVLRDNRDKTLDERMNYDSEEYKDYMKEFQSDEKEQGIGTVAINAETGASVIVDSEAIPEDEDEDDKEVDIVALFENKKSELTFDQCKETFINTYNITEEDEQRALYEAVMDSDNAEFDKLPVVIRSTITMAMPSSKDPEKDAKTRKEFTKFFLDNIKGDLMTDKAMIDLNREIRSAHEEANKITDELLEYNRELLEIELLKKADILEERGFKIKAKIVRECAYRFRCSYTYELMRRKWTTLKVKGKKVSLKAYLDNEVKSYKAYTKRFDNRYKTSHLNIHSSSLLLPTLRRQFPMEDERTLQKFVILFCMTSSILSPNKWEDHIFMYFTIQNIVSLDGVQDKEKGIVKEIITNIQSILDDIIK